MISVHVQVLVNGILRFSAVRERLASIIVLAGGVKKVGKSRNVLEEIPD
jgi:hypothetical protein